MSHIKDTGKKERVSAEIEKNLKDKINSLNCRMNFAIAKGLELFYESEKEGNTNFEDKFNKLKTQVDELHELAMKNNSHIKRLERQCASLKSDISFLNHKNNLDISGSIMRPDAQTYKEDVNDTYDLGFGELYRDYISIPSGEYIISNCKQQQFDKFSDKIKELKDQRKLSSTYAEESFALSIPMFKKLKADDKVIAVSFLKLAHSEREDYYFWKDYLDEQVKAAKAGTSIERIFITNKKELAYALESMLFVKMHMEEVFDETHLIGYYMDEDKYLEKISQADKLTIKQGFMLINSKDMHDRMAVVDIFDDKYDEKIRMKKNYYYNTDIIFNEHELNKLEIAFKRLLNEGLTRLSRKVINSDI